MMDDEDCVDIKNFKRFRRSWKTRSLEIPVTNTHFYDNKISLTIFGKMPAFKVEADTTEGGVSFDHRRSFTRSAFVHVKSKHGNTPENDTVVLHTRLSGSNQGSSKITVTIPSVLKFKNVRVERVIRIRALKNQKTSEHFSRQSFLPEFIIRTTAGPLGRGNLPLRSEYMARALAKEGYSVLYVPFGRVNEIEDIASDGRGEIKQCSSDYLNSNLYNFAFNRNKGIFICSSKCDATSLQVAAFLKNKNWKIVYEARDDLQSMKQLGFAQYYDPSIERSILELSDAVISVSSPIKQKYLSWGVDPSKIEVIENGFSADEVKMVGSLKISDVIGRKKKKAVYFGHLFPQRCDYVLIKSVSEAFPEYKFNLYGPGFNPNIVRFAENVEAFGFVTPEAFFEIESDAEIGLLPFKNNGMTFALSPLKIAQYLALGFKTVSTDIYQIRTAPMTFSNLSKSFVANFADACTHRITDADLDEAKEYAKYRSWSSLSKRTIDLVN